MRPRTLHRHICKTIYRPPQLSNGPDGTSQYSLSLIRPLTTSRASGGLWGLHPCFRCNTGALNIIYSQLCCSRRASYCEDAMERRLGASIAEIVVNGQGALMEPGQCTLASDEVAT